jgi:hypothetical protein
VEGSQRPRRALGPVPDDWSDPSDSSPTSPAGPLFAEPELTDTGMMRRLALNADGSLQNLVPPPRPVLPVSEAQPASAGRRFSADDAPHEVAWGTPRRSAVSVSSPPPAYEPLLPPVSRPTAPPPMTVNYPSSGAATDRYPAPIGSAPAARMAAPPAAALTPPPVLAGQSSTPTPPPVKLSAREERAAQALAKDDAKAAKKAEQEAAKQAAAQAKADAIAAKAEEKAQAKAEKAAAKSGSTANAVITDPAARLGVVRSEPTRAEPVAAQGRTRSMRPAIIVITAVVVFALITAGVVFVLANQPPAGTVGATAIDPLLTTADVTPISAGAWQESSVVGSPICVGESATKADRSAARKLFTATNDSVLQTMGTFSDDASAIKAYEAQLTLAGTCPNDVALVQSASTVAGLADTAQVVKIKVQAVKDENHTLLLTRTGKTVNSFDVVSATDIPITTVAQVAASSLARQCTGGACPSTISVASSLPAAGSPAGWLVPADLPRLTPGTGKWTSHDWAVNTPGSQCEGTDLAKVSGTTASGQRTLILTNDSKAPASFGVDQVNFTFADNKAAATLAASLTKSLTNCGTTLPTATVTDGPNVKGSGQGQVVVSGQTWQIVHKTATTTVAFRVAVVTSGNRVTYLLANPSKNFDFTDATWQAAALRAGQRATQA